MSKKTWIWIAVAVLGGVIAAPKLRTLPVLNKLPSI